MVGDLKYGRTVHSLCRLLSLYSVTLNFVSPPSLALPEDVKDELRRAGAKFYEHSSLDTIIGKTDVLYVTRVQQERFSSQNAYEAVKDAYIIDNHVRISLFYIPTYIVLTFLYRSSQRPSDP